MKYFSIKIFSFLFLISCLNSLAQEKFIDYVNPKIGTGGHGHTFPGAVWPFGMIQLSPDTRIDDSWDGCSGYHNSDSLIFGFSHTHLSGTGCSDWGDVLIMPGIGMPSSNPKNYASAFKHESEITSPGFYKVLLSKNNIKAELTVTPRVGIHRYTFPKNKNPFFVIDLLHRDKVLGCKINIIDSVTIAGFRISEAWAKEQHVYFAIKFSKPIKNYNLLFQKKVLKNDAHNATRTESAFVYFNPTENLQVKIAISSVSIDGAMNNLNQEAKHWDFDKYKTEASEVWEKQLNKIEVSSQSKDEKIKFYTAMYHCFIHPSLNMDVDYQYRGRDNQIHTAYGFTNYTVFSLWDTYRALHPLFTIIERERTKDFIASFLSQYKTAGRLPVWELSSNETDCMIGYHSVSVITDALMKGIAISDTTSIYKAMLAASNYTRFGLPAFNQKEFLQVDDENESVSKSLEYAYDDWCISKVAALLHKTEDEKNYIKKSMAYRNLFDVSTGFMRPRKNGNWLSPFFANEINNHFTEGNSWQYSFYVPHDLAGLIKLYGGNNNFEKKLDELFTASSKTIGREQADVTGLIGQYAHGNEPSHHMAFLYNYIGKPQKSIEIVKKIATQFYKISADGLIGNEDCGQMSAWYVFACMGFYPVCPGNPNYAITEPLFEKVKINLENGKSFTLLNSSLSNEIINHLELNGIQTLKSELPHSKIMEGGELKFIKNQNADIVSNYGFGNENQPNSRTEIIEYLPAPIIHSNSQLFIDKMEVCIEMINCDRLICVYTTDGSEPVATSKVYLKPFSIDENCVVKAKIFSNHGTSAITSAKYFKLKNNYQITLTHTTNAQYTANGVQSLIDGIYGEVNWRKGEWLGLQEKNFELKVDLLEQKTINYFSLNCLQDSNSWILYPKKISFYLSDSNNPNSYKLVAEINGPNTPENMEVQIKKFESKLTVPLKGRFIKVVAFNSGKLPAWHLGAGGDSFIFCDELEVK